jgi:hypothetical protein
VADTVIDNPILTRPHVAPRRHGAFDADNRQRDIAHVGRAGGLASLTAVEVA